MRILYLCHRIPYPPNKGEKIRAFQQIRAMAAEHEVDVFTLADDPADMDYRAELARCCGRVTVARINPRLARLKALPFLFTRTPLTLRYFHSKELAAEVRKALAARSYDRIFVYCSAMAQYVNEVEGAPVLVDLVDVDSDKWAQYASFSRFPFSAVYRREGRRLREYERKICERAACVMVSTGREARILEGISTAAPVYTIPNGVDTTYFDPAAIPPDRIFPTIIFTGDMSYFPNQDAATWFARQVLPLVRRSVPDARFLIVGRSPSRAVQSLQKLGGVEVTGFVPDIRTYLARAHLAVAPFSIAAGIQNKILEAMAYGLPVVATSRATQGLLPAVAEVVETADTPDTMASRVVRLLREPESTRREGLSARERVARDYRWDKALNQLLSLVSEVKSEPAVSAS